MKVYLLAYGSSQGSGKGIERYSYDLFCSLKKKGIEVEIIGNSRLPQWINDLFYIPYKIIQKRDGIFHALSPREALFLPFLKKNKSIVTFHDTLPLTKYHYPKHGIFARIFYKIVFNIAKHSKYIVSNSYLTRNELIKKLGVNPKKISVINIVVDKKFKPQRKRKNKRTFYIGYLGSFVIRKRVDRVVRSFKIFSTKYPNINCKLIIGGGKPKHLISFDPKELLKKYRLKNVRLLGFVPEEKIVNLYNMFDVFIYPCEYDGYCLPILEAMACGLPVITIKKSKIPFELVKKTIRCKNENEIADMLYKLLTNKNLRNRISLESLNYSKKFTWEKYMEKLIKIYKKIEK